MTHRQPNPNAREIRNRLEGRGWKPDRWGNYVHPDHPERRFKFTKLALRYEGKHSKDLGGEWFNIRSDYYRNVKIAPKHLIFTKSGGVVHV